MITDTFFDTDPVGLRPDEVEDPFKAVEMFFRIMDVVEWSQYLKIWFDRALTRDYNEIETPGDLFFMYEQLTKLIEAGYHISRDNLLYVPAKTFGDDQYTAGEWLFKCKELQIRQGFHYSGQYACHRLNIKEFGNPLQFIHNFFKPKAVLELRSSLKNWVQAALSNTPLWDLEEENLWLHYENAEKIIEAFYLVLTQDAVNEKSNEH